MWDEVECSISFVGTSVTGEIDEYGVVCGSIAEYRGQRIQHCIFGGVVVRQHFDGVTVEASILGTKQFRSFTNVSCDCWQLPRWDWVLTDPDN